MDEAAETTEQIHGQRESSPHYHVIENAVGNPHGYRDDLFRSRRRAVEAARTRAHWLAAVAGCRVETLLGPVGRYLVTTGRSHDAGRMIAVEDCDDPACLEVSYNSMLDF
ncbi:hypothetical protein [Candidatus Nephthysia bennettiae]|uniref:Uncharacterized protein n=1 Tax=Candidatus Nephthysia bennettiae TaxID=3127016 RepID=A0A934KAG5_9BACT|nr:hypothetical protein [Candidatus Dormibacteraeota bacterium]MBJ7614274.1 hypothetical protein [Candidatus Dormibacteraeota bacterium]